MIELIKSSVIGDDLIQEYNLLKEDQLFECHLNNQKIGYAIIRKNETDRIYLIIAKKYQNKGYGSIIFKQLLSKINENIICSVPFDNIRMQRIIQKNKGIEIGRNKETIKYIIKKDNN